MKEQKETNNQNPEENDKDVIFVLITIFLGISAFTAFIFGMLLLSGCAIHKTETDMVKTKRKEIIHRDYKDKYLIRQDSLQKK